MLDLSRPRCKPNTQTTLDHINFSTLLIKASLTKAIEKNFYFLSYSTFPLHSKD